MVVSNHLLFRLPNPDGLGCLNPHTGFTPILLFQYQNDFFGVNSIDTAQAN